MFLKNGININDPKWNTALGCGTTNVEKVYDGNVNQFPWNDLRRSVASYGFNKGRLLLGKLCNKAAPSHQRFITTLNYDKDRFVIEKTQWLSSTGSGEVTQHFVSGATLDDIMVTDAVRYHQIKGVIKPKSTDAARIQQIDALFYEVLPQAMTRGYGLVDFFFHFDHLTPINVKGEVRGNELRVTLIRCQNDQTQKPTPIFYPVVQDVRELPT